MSFTRVSLAFLGIIFCTVSTYAGNAQPISCQDVFYQADMGVDFSNWQEGFWGFAGKKGLQLKYGEGGHIFATLHNTSTQPIKVNQLAIDGVDFEQVYKNGDIVWWKIRINPIPAGGFSEFVIRFRNKPKNKIAITLDTAAGKITLPIAVKQINYFWQSIAWIKKDSKLLLYVSSPIKKLPISDILIDGFSVPKNTEWHKLRDLNNKTILLAIVSLKVKWYQGQIHRISLRFDNGQTHTRFYRAVDARFIHFSYGYAPSYNPNSTINNYNRFGVFLHINFGRYDKKGLDKLAHDGMQAIFGSVKPKDVIPLNGHKAFYGVYLMDEPDCHDYYIKQFPHKLRIGYHGRKIAPLENEFTLAAPHALVYLTIDNTYKPINWYTYGQIGDVVSTDPYCLGIGKQPSWAARAITQAFYGAAPKPIWAIIDAFYPPKRTKKKFPRFASPEELRQTAYYCLASGARGLGYYINCTDRKFTGWNDNPLLQNEIKQMAKEFQIAGQYLAKGTPVEIVRYKSDAIFARSILSGRNNIVIVIVNKQMHSEKLGPVIPRIPPDTKIDVKIPDWWTNKTVTAKFVGPGLENMQKQYTVKNGFVTIPLRYNFYVAGAIILQSKIESKIAQ